MNQFLLPLKKKKKKKKKKRKKNITHSIHHTGVLAIMEHFDNTRLIFIRGIHSWTNAKMKEFIYSK